MSIDVKKIGIFGFSFSRGFDQTWFNLWLKEDGYSMDLYQDVEADDGDDDPIESMVMITLEQGEDLLRRAIEDGQIEAWKESYGADDEGIETDLAWTLDIDEPDESDIFFSSGNGKLPPRELIMGMLAAIRTYEPRFAMCFKELR